MSYQWNLILFLLPFPVLPHHLHILPFTQTPTKHQKFKSQNSKFPTKLSSKLFNGIPTIKLVFPVWASPKRVIFKETKSESTSLLIDADVGAGATLITSLLDEEELSLAIDGEADDDDGGDDGEAGVIMMACGNIR